ncbi:22812_t:CDS:2 [Dentiscutata erythropus]|uniref:22812_t:CDS:1 n=1 Tax=Dentiscutata erythropus TaxID=1348616 RepID=A0A9N9GQ78_9GLOM|nr:22812_t:CDS:2 [Dentiscutata erythropus]
MFKKKYNTRSQREEKDQEYNTSNLTESSDINDAKLSENCQEFNNFDSPLLNLLQLAFESKNQLETSNKCFQSKTNKNNRQILPDQSLKVPNIEILTNNVKSNSQLSNIKQLAKSLSHHSDQQQKKHGQYLSDKLLSKFEWNELDELILLLLPFAQSTKLIGGTQYPTLGMMLPTISLLTLHLCHIKRSLKSSEILNVCQLIENSIFACWESPLMEAYIASYLDPSSKIYLLQIVKKKEVLDVLSKIIKTNNTSINTPAKTEMNRFFDYVVNDELERYEKVTQMNKLLGSGFTKINVVPSHTDQTTKYVLSIDGGGIRGLIPALILEEIETQVTEKVKARINKQEVDVRIADLFDFVSGTSTGSIIALGLVVSDENNRPKLKASQIVKIYRTEGNKIFSKGFLSKFLPVPLLFLYDPSGIEELLRTNFGDKKIIDSDIVNGIKVLIPSFNITHNKRAFFTNYILPKDENEKPAQDEREQKNRERNYAKKEAYMRDAIRASTAAPVYFPSARIEIENGVVEEFIDGGVVMNNPSTKAYTDSKRYFERENPNHKIVMCSFSTGYFKELPKSLGNSTYRWVKPIISLTMTEEGISNNNIMQSISKLDKKNLTYHRFTTQLNRRIELDSMQTKDIEELENAAKKIMQEKEFSDLVDDLSNHYIAKMPKIKDNQK